MAYKKKTWEVAEGNRGNAKFHTYWLRPKGQEKE